MLHEQRQRPGDGGVVVDEVEVVDDQDGRRGSPGREVVQQLLDGLLEGAGASKQRQRRLTAPGSDRVQRRDHA